MLQIVKGFQSFAGPFISAINIWMAIGPAKDILQSMVAHDLVYPMATSKVYILKIKRLVGNSSSS